MPCHRIETKVVIKVPAFVALGSVVGGHGRGQLELLLLPRFRV